MKNSIVFVKSYQVKVNSKIVENYCKCPMCDKKYDLLNKTDEKDIYCCNTLLVKYIDSNEKLVVKDKSGNISFMFNTESLDDDDFFKD